MPVMLLRCFSEMGKGMNEPRHHVLPLAEEGEIAEEMDPRLILMGVVGKEDPGARSVVPVPQHHFLDNYRRAPFVGNLQMFAIGPGAIRVPRIERQPDRLDYLLERLLFQTDTMFGQKILVGDG